MFSADGEKFCACIRVRVSLHVSMCSFVSLCVRTCVCAYVCARMRLKRQCIVRTETVSRIFTAYLRTTP